jgi:RNA polymerase sigma factor (sigma-70 family)
MQAGDIAALDRFAREHGARLLAVARRACRSRDDAEDAVQQALVQASSSMRGFRGDGDPVAWLATLVARSCYRMNRANDPARTAELADDVPCACEDPEDMARTRELGARLGDALMTLPRVERLLFLLAAEGWTTDELAAHFSLTGDAVRGRMKRARKILRAALTHDAPIEAHKGHAHPE